MLNYFTTITKTWPHCLLEMKLRNCTYWQICNSILSFTNQIQICFSSLHLLFNHKNANDKGSIRAQKENESEVVFFVFRVRKRGTERNSDSWDQIKKAFHKNFERPIIINDYRS